MREKERGEEQGREGMRGGGEEEGGKIKKVNEMIYACISLPL